MSFFVLTNGKGFCALPMAQDHKRLGEGDEGPNTGGMGTIAPMDISDEVYQQIIREVVEPTIKGLNAENYVYRGVVFIGLMMTQEGPRVIEYNIRFGDPETQVLLPLLNGDWADTFLKISKGELPTLKWKINQAICCVVLAAENYPASPIKGTPILGLDAEDTQDQYFLHAGTDKVDAGWVTAGGRVLNAMGRGSDLKTAIEQAYKQAGKVQWKGMQLRKDIGQKAVESK